MKPRLLFAHGWALDRSLWDGVLAALGDDARDAIVLDAGYYGRPVNSPAIDPARPLLGVGQSLGALELLTAPPAPLAGLVVLDGFARFAATADFPQGVPLRVLQLMKRRLGADPQAVAAESLTRALAGQRTGGQVNRETLAQGLDRLMTLDGRAAALELAIWRLHASNDPVADPAAADASFAGARVIADVRREAADHLSPITAPGACARLIRAAVQALST